MTNLVWNKEGVQPHHAVLLKKSKERMETVLRVTEMRHAYLRTSSDSASEQCKGRPLHDFISQVEGVLEQPVKCWVEVQNFSSIKHSNPGMKGTLENRVQSGWKLKIYTL